ncbi:MAG: HlyD family efflux transporter periplasmic adaptor subunit [Mariniphaga sp.]|nr:HlyD family efflux transporter periplasmic adaptor subunit [Mariniphaga sp.]
MSIYLLIIGIIISCLIALPFVMLDITVQARGVIRSMDEPNSIQTPVTGQVKEMRIHENMKVSVGDTLIWLASEKIDDQLRMLEDKLTLYSSYIYDLDQLTEGMGIHLRSELLMSSWAEYGQKLAEYEQQIETTNKDYQRTKLLFGKGVVAAAEFEKKELELNQLTNERDFYVSQKKSAWHQQLFQYKTEYQTLTDHSEQLKFEKRFYVLIAPANGYISNFAGIQTGSFIFPNQTIATITPSDSLIVECYVSPNDIGYLKSGAFVAFQVDAYNYNQWGLATGKIIDISNQLFQDKNTAYFKVKCKLDQDCLSLKSGYQGKLKNGLTLTSRFMVTRRSLYNLLFDKTDDWLNPKIVNVNN